MDVKDDESAIGLEIDVPEALYVWNTPSAPPTSDFALARRFVTLGKSSTASGEARLIPRAGSSIIANWAAFRDGPPTKVKVPGTCLALGWFCFGVARVLDAPRFDDPALAGDMPTLS